MTDYFPLLERAVAGLDPNAPGESRRALYERARAALIQQLRTIQPPLSESEIIRERLSLEEAIRKVESEAADRRRGLHRQRFSSDEGSSDRARGETDPLAELARLIGQTDPFASMGRTYEEPEPEPEEDYQPNPVHPLHRRYGPRPPLRGEIDQPNEIQLPQIPTQGYGPHFEIGDNGIINFAPAQALDRQGNNVVRLTKLHPILLTLSSELVEALSHGNVPHRYLRDRAEAYRELINQDIESIDFAKAICRGCAACKRDESSRV